MTQPMQIQSAVIPAFEPESMKVVDAGCVKAGSRVMPGMTQRGFSLVSAIFLLVVIAALGTFAVTLSTTQHQSAAMDVMGKRAYQAARAGIEWGAFQIIQSNVAAPPNGAGGFAANCQLGPTSSQVTLTGTLATFNQVLVTCTSTPPVLDAVSTVVYTVTASAVTGGSPGNLDYIERQLSVTIAQ